MLARFDIGCGVMWSDADTDRIGYGVVLDRDEFVHVVPVNPLTFDVKRHDEGGARYETDRHNVRLRDCPPPFTMMCAFSDRYGCYAEADLDNVLLFSDDDIVVFGLQIVDGGDKVSERDMSDIRDHPWRDEKQLGWQVDDAETHRHCQTGPDRPSGAFGRLMASIHEPDSVPEPEQDAFEF